MSSAGKLILVGGGVRSGKSAFAVELARRAGDRRTYIATAEALDDEMAARIAAHRRARGEAFATIEEPLDLPGALGRCAGDDSIVVDCLTLWISNLIHADRTDEEIENAVMEMAGIARSSGITTIVVTNEVGMGIVPDSPLARRFRDLTGRAHQLIAAQADEVYFALLGMMVRLKPEMGIVPEIEIRR